MIEHGATTMGNAGTAIRWMGDPSMNSYNHYAYGAVAEWLYRYAAGIDESSEDPGFHRIVLHPQVRRQRWAKLKPRTIRPYGPIASNWK